MSKAHTLTSQRQGMNELIEDNEALSNEVEQLKEETLELKHSLSQVKLNNDVASHEVGKSLGNNLQSKKKTVSSFN